MQKGSSVKSVVATTLLALSLSACTSGNPNTAAATSTNAKSAAASLSRDEKHRLYSAALAASESPLDTDQFKEVCQRIGIFDGDGKPNNHYMAFVGEHVDWGMNSETENFRQEINTKEKARAYIDRHLP
jgi:hypothetical protein